MLPTAEVIVEAAQVLASEGISNLVVDPVVRSTSGFDLIDEKALESLVGELFPLALIVTPNLQEAERISGVGIRSRKDLEKAANVMLGFGAHNVLIKAVTL